MATQKNPPPLEKFFNSFLFFLRTILAVIRAYINQENKIRIFPYFFTTITFFSSLFLFLFPFFPICSFTPILSSQFFPVFFCFFFKRPEPLKFCCESSLWNYDGSTWKFITYQHSAVCLLDIGNRLTMLYNIHWVLVIVNINN